MSCNCYIRIEEQTGPIEINEQELTKNMEEDRHALFDEHIYESNGKYNGESLFRVHEGELQIYEGGYDTCWKWGDRINVYGMGASGILKSFAKFLKKGKIIFSITDDEGRATMYVVEPGKARKAKLS